MTKKTEAVATKEQCSFEWTDEAGSHRCDHEVTSKGLCWTHYQQERRQLARGVKESKIKLTPIRPRGLTLLAGNIRVDEETASILQQRVKDGKAVSVYEATRQAVLRGVAAWKEDGAKK